MTRVPTMLALVVGIVWSGQIQAQEIREFMRSGAEILRGVQAQSQQRAQTPAKQRPQTERVAVRGPSFDCGRARAATERAICADPLLAELDQQLSVTYSTARDVVSGRAADTLVAEQRRWVSRRDRCGRDARCIAAEMKERIGALEVLVAASGGKESPTYATDKPASRTLSVSGPERGAPIANLGPSFDCAKATTATERAICADPELAMLDREVDRHYSSALSRQRGSVVDLHKTTQRRWLQERNGCGGNVRCLAQKMDDRIGSLARDSGLLSQVPKAVAQPGAVPQQSGSARALVEPRPRPAPIQPAGPPQPGAPIGTGSGRAEAQIPNMSGEPAAGFFGKPFWFLAETVMLPKDDGRLVTFNNPKHCLERKPLPICSISAGAATQLVQILAPLSADSIAALDEEAALKLFAFLPKPIIQEMAAELGEPNPISKMFALSSGLQDRWAGYPANVSFQSLDLSDPFKAQRFYARLRQEAVSLVTELPPLPWQLRLHCKGQLSQYDFSRGGFELITSGCAPTTALSTEFKVPTFLPVTEARARAIKPGLVMVSTDVDITGRKASRFDPAKVKLSYSMAGPWRIRSLDDTSTVLIEFDDGASGASMEVSDPAARVPDPTQSATAKTDPALPEGTQALLDELMANRLPLPDGEDKAAAALAVWTEDGWSVPKRIAGRFFDRERSKANLIAHPEGNRNLKGLWTRMLAQQDMERFLDLLEQPRLSNTISRALNDNYTPEEARKILEHAKGRPLTARETKQFDRWVRIRTRRVEAGADYLRPLTGRDGFEQREVWQVLRATLRAQFLRPVVTPIPLRRYCVLHLNRREPYDFDEQVFRFSMNTTGCANASLSDPPGGLTIDDSQMVDSIASMPKEIVVPMAPDAAEPLFERLRQEELFIGFDIDLHGIKPAGRFDDKPVPDMRLVSAPQVYFASDLASPIATLPSAIVPTGMARTPTHSGKTAAGSVLNIGSGAFSEGLASLVIEDFVRPSNTAEYFEPSQAVSNLPLVRVKQTLSQYTLLADGSHKVFDRREGQGLDVARVIGFPDDHIMTTNLTVEGLGAVVIALPQPLSDYTVRFDAAAMAFEGTAHAAADLDVVAVQRVRIDHDGSQLVLFARPRNLHVLDTDPKNRFDDIILSTVEVPQQDVVSMEILPTVPSGWVVQETAKLAESDPSSALKEAVIEIPQSSHLGDSNQRLKLVDGAIEAASTYNRKKTDDRFWVTGELRLRDYDPSLSAFPGSQSSFRFLPIENQDELLSGLRTRVGLVPDGGLDFTIALDEDQALAWRQSSPTFPEFRVRALVSLSSASERDPAREAKVAFHAIELIDKGAIERLSDPRKIRFKYDLESVFTSTEAFESAQEQQLAEDSFNILEIALGSNFRSAISRVAEAIGSTSLYRSDRARRRADSQGNSPVYSTPQPIRPWSAYHDVTVLVSDDERDIVALYHEPPQAADQVTAISRTRTFKPGARPTVERLRDLLLKKYGSDEEQFVLDGQEGNELHLFGWRNRNDRVVDVKGEVSYDSAISSCMRSFRNYARDLSRQTTMIRARIRNGARIDQFTDLATFYSDTGERWIPSGAYPPPIVKFAGNTCPGQFVFAWILKDESGLAESLTLALVAPAKVTAAEEMNRKSVAAQASQDAITDLDL